MTSSATAFSISIEPSKMGFFCTSDETILAAGIRQGVGLPYGCKDGACGSCKCKMTSGTVTHANFQRKALSEEEEANQFVLTCCAKPHSDIVLESRQVTQLGALPIKKMPTRVSSLVKKSPDVVLMHLQLPANDTFAFRAGQYIEFILRDGSRRSYSMANAPNNGPSVELHIRHMPGGRFTDLVFGSMKEKDILRMEGPFGSFYLREDSDKPMVFLASGTGFAPLKALLEHMQHTGIIRPTTLYWGGRRPSDLYLQEWIAAQLALMPNLTFIPVVSDALPDDQWTGRTGFVHQAVLDDFADLSAYEVYACGAPIVVDSARKTFCDKAHLPEDAFFADSFTSEADKKQA